VWTYVQSTGQLWHNGVLRATGYSGCGAGLNNPECENEPGVGPVPDGMWWISLQPFDSPTHGPCCLRLIPRDFTDTHGRTGFLIHGDRIDGPPWSASRGCIVLPRAAREEIAASIDPWLQVVSSLATFDPEWCL
jgi:hypothetical protein